MKLTHFVISLLLLVFSCFSYSASRPSGSIIFSESAWQTHNANVLAAPASLMKLLTATAAWDVLGPDYYFTTSIDYQQLANHRGNIQLNFRGDPSLSIKDLKNLIHALKREGIHSLHSVVVNDQRYQGHPWGIGQVWNDHGICFAAPVGSIILSRNCLQGNLKPTQIGKLAHLYIANYAGVAFKNEVVTRSDDTSCEPLHQVTTDNQFTLTGCINRHARTLPLAFSVVNTRAYLKMVLTKLFKEQNIRWNGQLSYATHSKQISNSHRIEHHSVTVDKLIHRMLKKSDNVIADSLIKQIAWYRFKRPGSYKRGAKVVWAVLNKYGIKQRNQVIRDGSGLSRENLIYPHTFYQVLKLWLTHPKFKPLINDLPIAGVDGTLRYRRSMRNNILSRHVIAKTGSMDGVSNLAGYLRKGHKLYPFVLIGNHISADDPQQSSSKSMADYEKNWLINGMKH